MSEEALSLGEVELQQVKSQQFAGNEACSHICLVVHSQKSWEESSADSMKFTHDLKFNKAPDWKDQYIDYWHLKKLIYKNELSATQRDSSEQPERQRLLSPIQTLRRTESARQPNTPQRLLTRSNSERLPALPGANETRQNEPLLPLLERSLSGLSDGEEYDDNDDDIEPADDDREFMALLTLEIDKVNRFYITKEQELTERSKALTEAKSQAETSTSSQPSLSSRRRHSLDSSSGGGYERLEINEDFWSGNSVDVRIKRETLRAELQDLYVRLHDLIAYNELNREGFRKALKKHDKVLAMVAPKRLQEQRPRWESVLSETSKEKLQGTMAHVLSNYAQVCCNGNEQLAILELKRHLRDRLVYERQTVWKEMVEKERRKGNAYVESSGAAGSSWWERYRVAATLALSVAAFVTLLAVPTFEQPEKRNCLAMLAFVSLLWCTEALPLYVTAMLVPVLTVVLRLLTDASQQPPRRLSPQEAAPRIFHTMFSQVIMLLLGGFSIAAALSKHYIAKAMATWVLLKVGQKPAHVLLASMFVAMFASMWISNVAAPALCFSLLQPILRTLETGDQVSKALVMGIALASNLGGMTSPISSPQNIFAIERMSMEGGAPSWLAWFAVSLPVSIAGAVAIWGLLLLVYPANVKAVRRLPELKDKLNVRQVFVIGISVLTVGLWCANSWLQRWTGEMGIIAVLPLAAFFGSGLLGKDDFNGFLWNVVMLAMGGLALGEAVSSSGLLEATAKAVSLAVRGLHVWVVLLVFCLLVLVATTFISHTVGAMVILPIIQTVGAQLPDPHPKLLVMGAALMCSGAMGLPVSGFPNMTAIALEDATGRTYVKTLDFLKVGLLSSFVTYWIVVTLGYVLMVYVVGW